MNPPSLPDPSVKDKEHLKLLAVFHFVVAGLGLLGIGFLFLHYSLMSQFLTHQPSVAFVPAGNTAEQVSEMPAPTPAPASPVEFRKMMMVFYVAGGAFIVMAMAVNVLSGMFLLRRRNRIFSLVIAGFNCMWFPFGTVLGVFTFIVLLRESVMRLYAEGITNASR